MSTKEELRMKVLEEIQKLEELKTNGSKSLYRSLHVPAVQNELERNQRWIRANYPKYSQYFANGDDIRPSAIQPCLIEVTEQYLSDLFRLARLTWSLPFTSGYGRRMRFLIMDLSNMKLIGILGLQSPPLDFPARDRLFSYPVGRKVELINQTMDIYTLGALPPYNRLLGGKLVALAAVSNEIRESYERKYSGRITEMEKRELPSHLVALTTTSAFGRSSIYNRLIYQGRLVAQPIGYTEGYGSFHLSSVYPLMRKFLEEENIPVHTGFGSGPRVVWQTVVKALERLGLSKKLLKHGIKREVFLFPLAVNLKEYLEGRDHHPIYYEQSFDELAAWWRDRWLLKRAARVDGWHAWSNEEIKRMLILERSHYDRIN